MLTRTQRVAQIDIQQRGLALARRLALPVNREEIIVAKKERAVEVSLRGDHEPRASQASPQIAPRCLPPSERLHPVGDGSRGEVEERVVNARELGAARVPQQEGPVHYVAKSPAAEHEGGEVLRAQVQGDLFDQFGRECVERHVPEMSHAPALIGPAQRLKRRMDGSVPAATADSRLFGHLFQQNAIQEQ